MRPYDVTDGDQFLTMESDNFPQDPNKWAILHSGDFVTLQSPVSDVDGSVSIPTDQFRAIVDWFMADQPVSDPSEE